MRRFKLDPKKVPADPTNWERLRKMSEGAVVKAARADPDAQPLTAAQLAKMTRIPDVRLVRQRLKMTQAQFAEAFGLAIGTIRDWEQGRFIPDGPARILLTLIVEKPELVRQLLSEKASATGIGVTQAKASEMTVHHVVPHNGRWAVKSERVSTSVHETKAEAVEWARKRALRNHSELIIHGRDGKVRDRSVFGSDPRSPGGHDTSRASRERKKTAS